MISIKLLVSFSVLSTITAAPQGQYGSQQNKGGNEIFQPMPYNYEWAVKDDYSGNDFGQRENSNGNFVQGSYYVLLPDGRKQTVTYTVDDESGYVANVEYEGEAQFPQSSQSQGYSQQPQRKQGGYN